MRAKYIQSTITTGRLTLPMAVFITIVCWIVVNFIVPAPPQEETKQVLWKFIHTVPVPLLFNQLACLFIYFAIGYLLIQMNNTFGLIRVRASAQTSFFLLLIAASPLIEQTSPGDIATLLFVVALYLLFGAYQKNKSSGYLFHAFIFVGLGSMIFPQITLLAPMLLVGAFNFQALNPRSFFAAIIGWLMPYYFLFAYAFYYDKMEMFYRPFIELADFYPVDFNDFASWQIAILGYSFLLFVVSSIHSFIQSYKDKIRTRIHLRFFILLNVAIYLLIGLQPVHCTNLLPLSLVGVSILASHMFVLTSSKASNFFFACSMIGLIGLFLLNLWMFL